MLDAAPNPQDVADYRLAELLRQPGNVARLLAMRQAREQQLDQARDPWVVWNPRGGSSLDSALDVRLPLRHAEAQGALDATPYLLAAATPGLGQALGRGISGLRLLRDAYNARNEQVYGPAATYGYYGPGQRAFDAATQHGEGDPISPVARYLGYQMEPSEQHTSSIWDMLGVGR